MTRSSRPVAALRVSIPGRRTISLILPHLLRLRDLRQSGLQSSTVKCFTAENYHEKHKTHEKQPF